MALIDLSPEKITKIELSSFCEQMDQMYFLPEEDGSQRRRPAAVPSAATNPSSAQARAERVSVLGLVSAIDAVQSEIDGAVDSPRTEEPQLLPAHTAARQFSSINFNPLPMMTDLLESTVDWCGQPTPRAQWLKKRFPPPRRCTTSAAAAQRRPLQRSPVPQQPRASSARPTSAASIGAEYRDLTESEVAADVAVRHLGGSSCSSPDERRFWAFMAPRPYPIRKNLPSSRSSRRLARLEFVSLCGPKPENCHPRPSRLSEASATAFEPPPASPSSRPATATASASGRLAQRTVGRPLTGRPRPPAAAVGATASVSDLGDSPLSPRPPAAPAAAAATIGGDRQAAESQKPQQQRRPVV
ncbi:hypothetical protein BOX15_Mlig023062g1 [Macrostomum lignano]|uniref:Uncharacterized protein n=3 Tax=Macrostomum lignano TaxID=282301 RepID=A0A267FBP9_9PLAT|nr:hypothetical protein BOX15_Mlig023062g1 [Macrostomum lignano]